MPGDSQRAAFDKSRVIFYADRKKPAEIIENVDKVVKVADIFARSYGLEVGFHELSLPDAIRMYSRDIDKMADLDGIEPNKYRQAASLAIWLVRLKPIQAVSFKEETFFKEPGRRDWASRNINELFALYIALSMIIGAPSLRDKFEAMWRHRLPGEPEYDDLVTFFRYRVVSRHAIAILLEMLCEYKLPAIIGKLR